jgi:hypothetical protein
MSSSVADPDAQDAHGGVARLSGEQQPAAQPAGPGALSLVDLAVLRELEADLGSPEIVRNFARDYTLIRRRRHLALARALEKHERATALDAVISLRISSAMVGGMRLAHLAETLQAHISAGDLETGEALLASLDDCGSATVEELQLSYLLNSGPPPSAQPYTGL